MAGRQAGARSLPVLIFGVFLFPLGYGHGLDARDVRGVLALLRVAASQSHLPAVALRRDVDRNRMRRGVAVVSARAASGADRRVRARMDRTLRVREEQACELGRCEGGA